MTENTLTPLQWGVIVILTAFVLYVVSAGFHLLWQAWRAPEPEPPPPLYDWARDDGLLDVWARDEEGEVLSVIPTAWYLRAEDAR